MWLSCPHCIRREQARIAKKFGKRRCRECNLIHGIEGVPQEVLFRSRRSYMMCFLHHLEYEEKQ